MFHSLKNFAEAPFDIKFSVSLGFPVPHLTEGKLRAIIMTWGSPQEPHNGLQCMNISKQQIVVRCESQKLNCVHIRISPAYSVFEEDYHLKVPRLCLNSPRACFVRYPHSPLLGGSLAVNPWNTDYMLRTFYETFRRWRSPGSMKMVDLDTYTGYKPALCLYCLRVFKYEYRRPCCQGFF